MPTSSNGSEDSLPKPDSPSVPELSEIHLEGCLAQALLEAYLSRTLTDDDASGVETHLAACDVCRDRVAHATLHKAQDEMALAMRLRRSSILVTLLNGDGGRPLARVTAQLMANGGTFNPDEDGEPWVAFDTSIAEDGAGHFDVDRIEGLLELLRGMVRPHSSLGMIVTGSRGYIHDRGVYGSAIQLGLDHRAEIEPGQVRVHAGLLEALKDSKLRTSPVIGTRWMRLVAQDEATESAADVVKNFGKQVFGWLIGPAAAFEERLTISFAGFATTLGAAQVQGPENRAPRTVYRKGDQLVTRFTAPRSSFAYLIRQNGPRLSLPHGPDPVRRPDQAVDREIMVVLDAATGDERLALLVSPSPVQDLAGAIETVQRLTVADSDSQFQSLLAFLRDDRGHRSLLLVHSMPFRREAQTQDLPASLKRVREAEHGDLETLEAAAKALLADPPSLEAEIEARLRLGRAYRRAQRLEAASDALDQAFRQAETHTLLKLQGDIRRDQAWLAIADHAWAEGLGLIEEALTLHARTRQQLGMAMDRLCLGWIHFRCNRLPAAHHAYRWAIHTAHQAGETRIELAASAMLGQVCQDLGHFSAARAAFERALQLHGSQGDLWARARLLGDLGQLEIASGDIETGLTHLRDQLELSVGQINARERRLIEYSLGEGLLKAGHHGEARPLLERLLEEASAAGEPIAQCARIALLELALAEERLEAAQALVAGLAPLSEQFIQMRWRAALARGRVREALGDPAALQAYAAGIASVEVDRAEMPRSLRRNLLEVSVSLYQRWIRTLVAQDASDEALLLACERSRARAFLDQIEAPEHPAALAILGSDVGHRSGPGDYWQSLLAGALAPGDPPPIVRQGSGPVRAADAADREVPSSSDAVLSEGGLRCLLDGLKGEEAFIAYQVLPESLLIFGLAGGVLRRWMVPSTLEMLGSLCRRFCVWVRTHPGAPASEALELEGRAAALSLSELLLQPLSHWLSSLPEGTSLGFVPHGPLHQLPFHALPSPANPSLPLVVDWPVHCLPSLAALARWREVPAAGPDGFAALLDVERNLHRAEARVQVLAEVMGGGELFVGDEATSSRLLEVGRRVRFLHLLVHGELAGDGRGAVLRLAAEGWARGRQRGALEGEEASVGPPVARVGPAWIAGLPLKAAVVTAIGCHTGEGEATPAGERPDLLAWAFLQAGARTVVAGGWALDYYASCALVQRFYEGLAAGKRPCVALAEAQRAMLQGGLIPDAPQGRAPTDYCHPYHWAALQLTGDGG